VRLPAHAASQVIVDAYQRGRLIAVLPFVTKLLECCKGSKIFTPTNPMIAGILSLLAELHGMKVGVRMCVRACTSMRVCMRACVYVCAHVRVCARVRGT